MKKVPYCIIKYRNKTRIPCFSSYNLSEGRGKNGVGGCDTLGYLMGWIIDNYTAE
jgi:hypothetical protein